MRSVLDTSYSSNLLMMLIIILVGLFDQNINQAQEEIPSFAFVASFDGNWDIYTTDETGELQQLTKNQGTNLYPNWSPDGKWIVFASNRGQTDDTFEHLQIYKMRSDGSDVRRLTNNNTNDGSPAWSTDGRQIAFDSHNYESSEAYIGQQVIHNTTEIYIMDSDGGNQHLFSPDFSVIQPTWSPDNQNIAYSVIDYLNTGKREIRVLVVSSAFMSEGTEDIGPIDIGPVWSAAILGTTPDMGQAVSPRWSPDGKQIAFVSNKEGNNNIYIINSDMTNLRRLTVDPGEDGQYGISWSPDGIEILYTVDSGINIVNVKTGLSRSTGINGINPAWRPQNTAIEQCPHSNEEGWVWVTYVRYNELLSQAQVQRDRFAESLSFVTWAEQKTWDLARERLTDAALVVLQLPKVTPNIVSALDAAMSYFKGSTDDTRRNFEIFASFISEIESYWNDSSNRQNGCVKISWNVAELPLIEFPLFWHVWSNWLPAVNYVE